MSLEQTNLRAALRIDPDPFGTAQAGRADAQDRLERAPSLGT